MVSIAYHWPNRMLKGPPRNAKLTLRPCQVDQEPPIETGGQLTPYGERRAEGFPCPREIIFHADRAYHRLALSTPVVANARAERGVVIGLGSIRLAPSFCPSR